MVMLETSEFVMYSLSCYTRLEDSVILSIKNAASSIYTHMFNKCSVIVLLSLTFFNGLEPSIRVFSGVTKLFAAWQWGTAELLALTHCGIVATDGQDVTGWFCGAPVHWTPNEKLLISRSINRMRLILWSSWSFYQQWKSCMAPTIHTDEYKKSRLVLCSSCSF
jgi:hypothetical protein